MKDFSLLNLETYFLLFFAVLAFVVIYYQFSNFEVKKSEQARLDEAQLNLGIVIRLLEQPDTNYLLSQTSTRRFMFIEYSRMLRVDVLSLIRKQELGLKTHFLVLVFYTAFVLMSIKSLVYTQMRDLRFLSGLGLRIFRSIPS